MYKNKVFVIVRVLCNNQIINTISLAIIFFRFRANAGKPREVILASQEKALRKMLRFAFENSEYYNKTFGAAGITRENISSMPLSQFPMLDKDSLMRNFDSIVTKKDLCQSEIAAFVESDSSVNNALFKNKYHIVHSSGSTGVPRYFVYDDDAWQKMLLGITRGALWGMSAKEILSLLKNRPKILYVAATNGRYGGAMAIGDGIRNLHARQKFLDIGEPFENWRKMLRDIKSDLIIGYPSAIKILAEKFSNEISELKIKRVVSCGEPLSRNLRNFIERKFNCPVINFYGASESLALGVEGSSSDSMFLFDDLNFIEIVDGKMFLTCLYNFTQPLIRYQLNDRLELLSSDANEKEQCNFTKSRVLLSRDEDVLWFTREDGEQDFLHPLSVEGLCVEGLLDYQFEKKSEAEFEMKIQVSQSADKKFVCGKIRKLMDDFMLQKRIDFVRYKITLVDYIAVNPTTGKKQLIVA